MMPDQRSGERTFLIVRKSPRRTRRKYNPASKARAGGGLGGTPPDTVVCSLASWSSLLSLSIMYRQKPVNITALTRSASMRHDQKGALPTITPAAQSGDAQVIGIFHELEP